MHKLNSFYGRETTQLEFKEFCLKDNKNNIITNEKIIDMIEKNYIDESIKYLIQHNLKEYIKYLIPKYLTCFGNASINGKIVLGINDYGEISGIPIHKSINLNFLQRNLNQTIKNTIKKNVYCKTQDLHQYINIEFEKLTIDKKLLCNEDEINEIYENYCKKIIENNDIMNDYYRRKALWLNELEQYCTKLCIIINTTKTRNELIEYIKIYNKNEDNKKNLIELLLSSKVIHVPVGLDIAEIKEDTTNVIYWLTEYKDHMMKIMLDKKPKKPTNIYSINLYTQFLRLTHLTNRFIKDDYDYYILNINFTLIDNKEDIMYKYPKNDKWINRCRTIIDGNPCCF